MNRICRSLLSLSVLFCTSTLLRAQTTGTGTGTGTGTTTTPNTSGVLIYEMKFEHLAGFNIDFWKGGFVVVPGTGGTGTVVLTGKNEVGGKIYRQFASSAYFFQAKRKEGRSSVIQISGGSVGTSSPLVAMQAFGDVKGSITLESATFTLRVEAAKSLHGLAQASADESLIPATISTSTGGTGTTTGTTTTTANPARPHDGTLGYIEFAEMKLDYDSGKSNKANKAGRTVADTVTTDIIADLKAKGYTEAVSSSGSGTGNGGTGNGGTGNGGTGNGDGTTDPNGGTGTGT